MEPVPERATEEPTTVRPSDDTPSASVIGSQLSQVWVFSAVIVLAL